MKLVIEGDLDQPSEDSFSFANKPKEYRIGDAAGGTELMYNELMRRLPDDLKAKCQIIPSRVRELDDRQFKVLWLHDLAGDPEVEHLHEQNSVDRFDLFVFVSYMQRQMYLGYFPLLDPNKCIVLRNAIIPFDQITKPKDCLNLIYHTTPHRGLEILIPVFEEVLKHVDNITLDVYSSFNAYGWPDRDKPYEELFERCRNHPHIAYHGFQPNHVIREALEKAHIFAYPSIWWETSCISAIEAGAAGVEIVCSDYGALPETTAGFASMYHHDTNPQQHAQNFYQCLMNSCVQKRENLQGKFTIQQVYFNSLYNWDSRAHEWITVLNSLK